MTQAEELELAELPRNFSWLEPGKVAGCARPEAESELRALREVGVSAIVSLTGTPLEPEAVNKIGLGYLHSHISGTPTMQQLQQIVYYIEKNNRQGKAVLVHCGEGKGRTGTVLAAYLVYRGISADEAIRQVREKRPGSIESTDQENAVREFETYIRKAQD